jgi:Spy/CpxP family protein refolding chaperone
MNRILLTPVVALSLALAACSGSTTSTEASTASTAQAAQGMTKAPVAPQVTGHMRVVADALSDVPLRADQRAEIEQMASDAQARHAAAKTVHAQLANAIAAQIESGTIDRAALQPKVDATADALAAARPADRVALEQLHSLLTPDQRGQFADALQAHGKAAHHHEHGMHGRMEQWATDLKLTDDQRTQIAAIVKAQFAAHKDEMHEMHASHAQGHEFMDSFRNDTMAPAPAAQDMHPRANKMADTFAAIATQVLPLLTPEQRTLAAAKIREHAQAGEEEAPSFGE